MAPQAQKEPTNNIIIQMKAPGFVNIVPLPWASLSTLIRKLSRNNYF